MVHAPVLLLLLVRSASAWVGLTGLLTEEGSPAVDPRTGRSGVRGGDRGTTLAQCQQWCEDVASCRSISYNPNGNQCWLKTKCVTPALSTRVYYGYRTWYRPCRADGTVGVAPTQPTGPATAPTPARAPISRADERDRAWAALGELLVDEGSPAEDRSRTGSDGEWGGHRGKTLAQCQQWCEDVASCRSIAFNPRGGHCWPKTKCVTRDMPTWVHPSGFTTYYMPCNDASDGAVPVTPNPTLPPTSRTTEGKDPAPLSSQTPKPTDVPTAPPTPGPTAPPTAPPTSTPTRSPTSPPTRGIIVHAGSPTNEPTPESELACLDQRSIGFGMMLKIRGPKPRASHRRDLCDCERWCKGREPNSWAVSFRWVQDSSTKKNCLCHNGDFQRARRQRKQDFVYAMFDWKMF